MTGLKTVTRRSWRRGCAVKRSIDGWQVNVFFLSLCMCVCVCMFSTCVWLFILYWWTALNRHYISMHNWTLIFIAVFPAGGSCDCPQGPPQLRAYTQSQPRACGTPEAFSRRNCNTEHNSSIGRYTDSIYLVLSFLLYSYLSLHNNRVPCCTMT